MWPGFKTEGGLGCRTEAGVPWVSPTHGREDPVLTALLSVIRSPGSPEPWTRGRLAMSTAPSSSSQ